MLDEKNLSPFYSSFLFLCSQKDVSPSVAAREAGISSGAPTAWKRGAVPKPAQREKLCAYFGVTDEVLLGYAQKEKSAPEDGSGSMLPPGYESLNPTNKAIVDRLMAENKETVARLVADLVKSQPSSPEIKLEAVAWGGGEYETAADSPITLPERSVQALSDKYKGKTADTGPAPQGK